MDWERVLAAVQESLAGDREQGRRDLLACWAAISEGDGASDGTADAPAYSAAKRCVLAHYLADLEPALDDEVAWDERALAAYADVAAGDLAPVGISSAAELAPSLHLNLGDGYLRQGRLDQARAQLDLGLAAVGSLGDDGYGRLVGDGLRRLGDRLDDGPPG